MHASWQLDRADRAEVARLVEAIDEEAARLADDVAKVGAKLFRTPPKRLLGADPAWVDREEDIPILSWPSDPEHPGHPSRLVAALESTAAGCTWLLEKWAALAELLDQEGKWQPADQLRAIRLLGKQPVDAIADQPVLSIYLACHAMEPEGPDVFAQPLGDLLHRPEDEARYKRLAGKFARAREERAPRDAAAGREALRAIVAPVVARLEALREVRAALEAAGRAEISARVSYNAKVSLDWLHKHQVTCSRALYRSFDELRKLRKDFGAAPAATPMGGASDPEREECGEASDPLLAPGPWPLACADGVTNEASASAEAADGDRMTEDGKRMTDDGQGGVTNEPSAASRAGEDGERTTDDGQGGVTNEPSAASAATDNEQRTTDNGPKGDGQGGVTNEASSAAETAGHPVATVLPVVVALVALLVGAGVAAAFAVSPDRHRPERAAQGHAGRKEIRAEETGPGGVSGIRRLALAFPGDRGKIPRRGDPCQAGLALLFRRVAGLSCDLGRVNERVGPPRRARGASSRFPRWPGGPPTAQHVRIGAESPWQSAISRDGDVRTMKRQFIAGVMGLALAGCAHSRSEVPKGPGTGNPVGPVGMQPVPSIHDSVNRGTGNAAMAQSALGDPNDPRWSGRAPAPSPDPNRPGVSDAPTPSQSPQPAQMAAAAPADTPPNWSRSQVTPSPATSYPRNSLPPADLAAAGAGTAQPTQLPAQATQPPGTSERLNPTPPMDVAAAAAATGLPAGAAASALTAPGLGAGSGTGAQASPVAGSIPSTLERPGGPMPDMLAGPGGLQGPPPGTPAAGPAVAVGDAGASPGAPAESPSGGPRMTGPSVNGLEPVGPPPASLAGPATAPTDPAVSPSAGQNGQARGAATPGPAPAGDPLLGPNPDLMPQLPPLPDEVPAAKAAPAGAAAPGSAPTTDGPPSAAAALPALAPATGATDTPPALGPAASPAAPAHRSPGPRRRPGDSPPDLGPPRPITGRSAPARRPPPSPARPPPPVAGRGLRRPGPARGRTRRFPGVRAARDRAPRSPDPADLLAEGHRRPLGGQGVVFLARRQRTRRQGRR